MNIKKIIIVILIIVVVGMMAIGTVAWFFVKNFDANQYQKFIISHIETALGRQATIEDISLDLSLTKGITLAIKNLRISDKENFSNRDLLVLPLARLGVEFLPLIKQRKILASELFMQGLTLSLVRNESDQWNVLDIPALHNEAVKDPVSSVTTDQAITDQITTLFLALLVRDVSIKDAQLIFEDRAQDENMFLTAQAIDLKIVDLSLQQPFDFSLKASALSDHDNIVVDGTAQINMSDQTVKIKNIQGSLDLAKVEMEQFFKALPAAKLAKIKGPLSGKIALSMPQAKVGAQGLSDFSLKVNLSEGSVFFEQFLVPVTSIQAEIAANDQDIDVTGFTLSLGQGIITFNASVKDYSSLQRYSLKATMDELRVHEIMDQEGQDIKVEGIAKGECALEGKGLASLTSFSPDQWSGHLELHDGRLIDINILKIIFSRIDAISGLAERLATELPQEYKDKLQRKDTPLSEVILTTTMDRDVISLKKAELKSDVFWLSGQGAMDKDLNCEIQTQFFIPKDLSQSMIRSVEELGFLLDNEQRIVIPVIVSGQMPDQLRYLPDMAYITRRFIEHQGRSQLERLLNKAIGTRDTTQQGSDVNAQENPSPTGQQPSKEERIIGDVLDILFR